jgi:tetratricopeptide (TPR) repeat protein
MKSLKVRLLLSLSVFLLAACSYFQKNEGISGLPVDPAVRATQEKQIVEAEDTLEKQDFKIAAELFTKFEEENPQSIFIQQARLGLARSFHGLGDFAAANEIYRNVQQAARQAEPAVAARALYYHSFTAAAMGDDVRALALLTDAYSVKASLPEEIGLAELPARLAASYFTLGDQKKARAFFSEAESGVAFLRAKRVNEPNRDWLAKIYLMMGQFNTTQLGTESISAHIDSLGFIQIFLLRAVEAQGVPWSEKALEHFKESYRDLTQLIESLPMNTTMDQGAAQRELMDRKSKSYEKMLVILNELENYRSPEIDEKNQQVNALFAFASEVRRLSQDFLQKNVSYTPLTPESRRRQSIKQEGLTLEPVDGQSP